MLFSSSRRYICLFVLVCIPLNLKLISELITRCRPFAEVLACLVTEFGEFSSYALGCNSPDHIEMAFSALGFAWITLKVGRVFRLTGFVLRIYYFRFVLTCGLTRASKNFNSCRHRFSELLPISNPLGAGRQIFTPCPTRVVVGASLFPRWVAPWVVPRFTPQFSWIWVNFLVSANLKWLWHSFFVRRS